MPKPICVQLYGHLHIPYNSLCIVLFNWFRVLRDQPGIRVKIKLFTEYDRRFQIPEENLGEFKRGEAIVGFYFGYPSYVKVTGGIQEKFKVGVFVTETKLDQDQQFYLNTPSWARICVPSEYCKKLFQSYEGRSGSTYVVNHGIHKEFYEKPIHMDENNKREKFTFLYVFQNSMMGGTTIRKNLKCLIKAHQALLKDGYDADLLIKTTSNIEVDVTMLERKNKQLKFDIHYRSNSDMSKLYRSCHAYVNPTLAEGFGMTVIEAMASGLPILSPIHSGMTEYLAEKECISIDFEPQLTGQHYGYATNDGKLFVVKPHAITVAMKEAMDNYDKHKNFAMINRKFIMERFKWRNVMEETIKWIRSLS